MAKIFKNKYFYDYITLLIPLMLIEVLFRIVSGYSLLDLSLIRIFIGLNFLVAIITFFLNFCNNLLTKIIKFIIISVASIYASVQMGFLNFLGVYVSFQESSQMGAVTDYIKDFLKSFKPQYFIPLITILLFITFTIFFSKKFKYLSKIKLSRNIISTITILVLTSFLYVGTLTLNIFNSKYQTISNTDLFLTVSNTTNSITKFGTTIFSLLDIRQKLFPIKSGSSYVVNGAYYESNENLVRGITDEEWEQIIEATDNEDYEALNKYFSQMYGTGGNEYTSMFADKNVIFILMESVNDIFLQYPEYYPNINKLATEGWNFSNNYSPRNSCATLNNEFSGMTSMYSIANICTEKEYIDNTYFQSVFNLFNDDGYVTFSAHDYTEAYYPRSKIHPTLGSGEYFGVQNLGIDYSTTYRNWANDDEFFSKIVEIISEKRGTDNKKFMTWLTTVSSHQPYGYDSIQGTAYFSMTKDTGLPYDVRRYMSKLKILDNAIGVLLEGLENQGILDDTVIVLYGDHYPYGISTSHLNQVLDYDTSEDMNAEKVPLIIYNSEMTPTTYSDYTTYVNILPTIANLFGLDYDPSLMMGSDMLSESYESLVVFADGSWKNEHAYYDASTSEVKYYDQEYTEEDIARITSNVATKLQVSEQIIKTNYMAYLKTKLDEIRDNETNLCEVILNNNDTKACQVYLKTEEGS